MRILYAIQGTGNGHMARALHFVPALRRRPGVGVDVLLSGRQAELRPTFGIDYRLHGLGYVFGRRGGIDVARSLRQASLGRFLREVRALPVADYDLVVNDFEPVSAWAARRAGVPCLSLSHQYAVGHPAAPRPRSFSPLASSFIRWYAPCTIGIGFHFQAYAPELRYPVIRTAIRTARTSNGGHHTVYLPAYDEGRLINLFNSFSRHSFEVFSKRCDRPSQTGNVRLFPVSDEQFIRSMATAAGVLCGAGFETPSEVLYLGKKLLVVPMRGQFEQACNGLALRKLGATVLPHLRGAAARGCIADWLDRGESLHQPFPDETEQVLDTILSTGGRPQFQPLPRRRALAWH